MRKSVSEMLKKRCAGSRYVENVMHAMCRWRVFIRRWVLILLLVLMLLLVVMSMMMTMVMMMVAIRRRWITWSTQERSHRQTRR